MIVTLNGKAISSFASFRAEIGSLPVGTKMALGIIRDGKPVSIDVTLQQSSQEQVDSSNIYTGIEGAELSNSTDKVKGVKIEKVKPGSAAARIGLKKGDVIMGVNQQPINNLGELRKVLDSKPAVLALNIQRGDSTLYLLMQ
ncbi:Periplasmic serine endoprotease DegP precursor [compost metagenome]